MKHAVINVKPALKTTKIERTITVKGAKKFVETAAILPVGKTKTKAVEKFQPKGQKINLKKKAVAVVSKTKTGAAKAKATLSGKKNDRKNDEKKTIAVVPVEKNVTKTKKAAPVVIAAKPKIEKKKIEPAISLPKNRKTKATASPVSVQKIKLQIKKPETIAPPLKVSAEIQKIKSAVNVGKINAALKAIEAAQIKAAKTNKTEKRKLRAIARKSEVVQVKAETAALQTKIKPKNVKQIGAAVFRGRKNRYDFQVYPLDFEFENVSAIYVISKRKTDSKKRGHHALVCIGQTDSVMSELRKHTQGKCVKKHEANVISILPERSEKKRLKIEEDLKAAHAIVCNFE